MPSRSCLQAFRCTEGRDERAVNLRQLTSELRALPLLSNPNGAYLAVAALELCISIAGKEELDQTSDLIIE